MRSVATQLRALLAVIRATPFETATAQGRSNERYRRIVLSTAAGGAARVIAVGVGLATVPLTLGLLGKTQYGVFSAVTALVAWVSLFDLGLLNGLVNRIAEADGRDDHGAARAFFSTAFVALSAIAAGLAAVSLVAVPLVPWSAVFAAGEAVAPRELTWAMGAALLVVIAPLPLSTVRQAYAGYQRSYVPSLFAALGSLLTLLCVVLAVRARAGLPVLVLALGAPTAIAAAANLAYMLGRDLPWLRPALRSVSAPSARRLAATSFPMFLYQAGGLLVNETQAIVLAHTAGLDVVAEYAIVWRIYAMAVSVIAMGTASFVPAFREAHERGDREWLTRSFRRLLALRTAAALATVPVLVLGGNLLLRLWLRRSDVQFGPAVWIAVGALCVTSVWVSVFVDLLTIMDRVWPQVWLVLVQGLVTVALTIVLGARFGVLGALGAILAPAVVISGVFAPRLVKPLLSEAGARSVARPDGPDGR